MVWNMTTELLVSNYEPVGTSCHTFSDTFYDLLEESDRVDIATGFISADSLAELIGFIGRNEGPKLTLFLGMYATVKLRRAEYDAAIKLNELLQKKGLGEILFSKCFPFHGKIYSFYKNGKPQAGIIGSNNLSTILKSAKTYEASVLLKDPEINRDIASFLKGLFSNAGSCITDYDTSKGFKLAGALEEVACSMEVKKTDVDEVKDHLTSLEFEIPLKTTDKSNLNVFFGKGREDTKGFIRPRPWYEVELIVPKETTTKVGYPKAQTADAVFPVVTDDGWRFKIKISGDDSKNFRSEGDLTILGRWIKGRLEQAGLLKVGEPVTDELLERWGRKSLRLVKTSKDGLWFLDFSPGHR